MNDPLPPTGPALDLAQLEADLLEAFAAAQQPDSPDPALAQRVKQRLMGRIAALEDRHLTVPAAADGWQPFGPGLQIKVLHEHAGTMSYLLRLAPGAELPPHRHPQDEECMVLEGQLRIGPLVVGAGGFHLARGGSLHDRITTDTGATIYLRGAVPSAEHCV